MASGKFLRALGTSTMATLERCVTLSVKADLTVELEFEFLELFAHLHQLLAVLVLEIASFDLVVGVQSRVHVGAIDKVDVS